MEILRNINLREFYHVVLYNNNIDIQNWRGALTELPIINRGYIEGTDKNILCLVYIFLMLPLLVDFTQMRNFHKLFNPSNDSVILRKSLFYLGFCLILDLYINHWITVILCTIFAYRIFLCATVIFDIVQTHEEEFMHTLWLIFLCYDWIFLFIVVHYVCIRFIIFTFLSVIRIKFSWGRILVGFSCLFYFGTASLIHFKLLSQISTWIEANNPFSNIFQIHIIPPTGYEFILPLMGFLIFMFTLMYLNEIKIEELSKMSSEEKKMRGIKEYTW